MKTILPCHRETILPRRNIQQYFLICNAKIIARRHVNVHFFCILKYTEVLLCQSNYAYHSFQKIQQYAVVFIFILLE